MWIRHSLAFKYFLTFETLPYFYEILTQFHWISFYNLNLENYFNHFHILCQLWANCQGFRGLPLFKHSNVHIYKKLKPCFGPEQGICCYIFLEAVEEPSGADGVKLSVIVAAASNFQTQVGKAEKGWKKYNTVSALKDGSRREYFNSPEVRGQACSRLLEC